MQVPPEIISEMQPELCSRRLKTKLIRPAGGHVLDKYRVFQTSIQLTATILFFTLAFIIYGHVFSNGMCCADDSAAAIVAKNLALGKGYSNSIALDGVPGQIRFDPTEGNGPTIILPTAGLIYIFGNVPWVPGFVTATISLSLIVITAALLSRRASPTTVSAFLCTMLFFLYNLTTGLHFEQWYSLLGEIPAALLCVAGAVVLASNSDERSAIIASSAMYGLAVMAKLLALLAFIPIVVWLMYRIIDPLPKRRRRIVDCFLAVITFAVPFLAFELWKVVVLGRHQYVLVAKKYVSFVATQSTGTTASSSSAAKMIATALQTYSANAGIMQDHFRYSPFTLFVIIALVGWLVCCYAEVRIARLLYVWLATGSLILGLYWLFVSKGWPRYALICLSLYFAAISCVVFIKQSRLIVGSITLLLLITFSASYARLIDPFRFVATNKFGYTSRVVNLMKTVSFLKGLQEKEPFVMGWWATAVDVEYAMPGVGHFVQYDHVRPSREDTGLILVRNKVWVTWGTTPEFTAWEQRCNEVLFDAPPYLVSQCPNNSLPKDVTLPMPSASPQR